MPRVTRTNTTITTGTALMDRAACRNGGPLPTWLPGLQRNQRPNPVCNNLINHSANHQGTRPPLRTSPSSTRPPTATRSPLARNAARPADHSAALDCRSGSMVLLHDSTGAGTDDYLTARGPIQFDRRREQRSEAPAEPSANRTFWVAKLTRDSNHVSARLHLIDCLARMSHDCLDGSSAAWTVQETEGGDSDVVSRRAVFLSGDESMAGSE